MEIIGITGQTGAGKSTVCQALAAHGFYHIDADAVAKSLYVKGALILDDLCRCFGSQILTADGILNKPALAAAAFRDKKSTARLNEIVHPAVTEKIRATIDEQRAAGVQCLLIDAIALFESGESALCDRTVGVIAPESVRLARITARDGISESDALLRIRAQQDEAFYIAHCDEVIRNYPPHSLESELKRVFSI